MDTVHIPAMENQASVTLFDIPSFYHRLADVVDDLKALFSFIIDPNRGFPEDSQTATLTVAP